MIASSQNETVKTIRRLRRSKGEEAILEGPHLVGEALELGLELDPVLMTPQFAAAEAGRAIAACAARAPKQVEPRLLESLADADAPRGVLAVARLPRLRLSDRKLARSEGWLFIDRVQDPGNLGAIARAAEGLGATGLLLSPGCADHRHSRALRASAGSLLRLPVAEAVEAREAKGWSAGATWLGLEAHAGAEPHTGLDVVRPWVLAVGAEGQGLADATRAALDRSVTIPLAGKLESLNVAVATALVLADLGRVVRGGISPRAGRR
jgi:TrmH family RNA methyltransferase